MFDRFYPIFDSPEWLERMLPLGLKLVQLRCKTREGEALRKAITTAQALCDAHDCILVVNDYWREAIDAGQVTLKDINKSGLSFNWQYKKHNGYCDTDGKGTITNFVKDR